jgi:hypothetical protein
MFGIIRVGKMNYIGLKVEQIVRKSETRWGRENLTHLTVFASNENVNIKISCPKTDIGTYKNDNVKKVSDILTEGFIFDLIEGEQGWGINTKPKWKVYYSDHTFFMPDECEVMEKTKEKENVTKL